MGLARLAWMPAALALLAPGVAQAAFAPALGVSLEPPNAGQVPQVVAVVSQAERLQRFTLRFPAGFTANRSLAVPGCSAVDQLARLCPLASRIGQLEIDGNGSGPIHMAESNGLRTVTFLGLETIRGIFRPGTGDTLNVTFDGVPLLPRGTLRVILEGGERGLVRAPSACGSSTVAGNFTSAAGEMAVAEAPVTISGCAEAARVSAVRVSPRRFRPTVFTDLERPEGGTRLTWALDRAAAGTRVYVERRSGRRWKRVGSLLGSGDAGANTLVFDGRIRNRRLAPGVYHFLLQPRGGIATASPRFTVLR